MKYGNIGKSLIRKLSILKTVWPLQWKKTWQLLQNTYTENVCILRVEKIDHDTVRGPWIFEPQASQICFAWSVHFYIMKTTSED